MADFFCPYCAERFESEQILSAHSQAKHSQPQAPQQATQARGTGVVADLKANKSLLAVIVGGIVFLIVLVMFLLPQPVPQTGLATGVTQQVQVNEGINLGEKAPDFSITSIDGKQISLKEKTSQGKPTFLYFSASWCPICRRELSSMKEVFKEYKDRIDFIYISIDPTDTPQKLVQYRDSNGFTDFIYATAKSDVLVKYNADALGTKYGIAGDGVIKFKEKRRVVNPPEWWRQVFNSVIGA